MPEDPYPKSEPTPMSQLEAEVQRLKLYVLHLYEKLKIELPGTGELADAVVEDPKFQANVLREPCETCDGSGMVETRNADRSVRSRLVCHDCNGMGATP